MLAEQADILKEANRLISQGHVETALELLLERYEHSQDDIRVARAIGRIYLWLKQPEEAARFLRIAVNLQEARRKRRYDSESLTEDDLRFIEEQQESDQSDESGIPHNLEILGTSGVEKTVEPEDQRRTSAFDESAFKDYSEDERWANEEDPDERDRDETGPDEDEPEFDPDDNELINEDREDLWASTEERYFEDFDQFAEEQEFDWDDFEDFDDDYSEDDKEDEIPQIVAPEVKARQKAAELIEAAEWDRGTVDQLVEFFLANTHGATRKVVTEYACVGLCIEELWGAWHLRNVWAQSEHYWMSFKVAWWANETAAAYCNLSWVQAIEIVRSFRNVPCEEELETFLEAEFEYWYTNSTMRRRYPAFIKYLKYRTAGPRWSLHEWEPRKFAKSVEDRFETDREEISASSHDLQHLLVELECDPFIERLPRDRSMPVVSLARFEEMEKEMSSSEKRKFIGYA